jgi:hypothetical protein
MRKYAQMVCAVCSQFSGQGRGSVAMKAVTDVHCSKDASHNSLDLRSKRCRECHCGLQKKCPDCEKVVSYSNAAKHAKHCKESPRGC